MNIFARIVHWFSHFTGNNTGKIISFRDDTTIYMAFKCDTCGEVEGLHSVKPLPKAYHDNSNSETL